MNIFKKSGADGDVSEQLKKIAEQLVFLEKKLDTLLEQSRNRKPFTPGFGGGNPRNSGGNFRHNNSGGNFAPRRNSHGPNRYESNRGPAPTRYKSSQGSGRFEGNREGGNRGEGHREGNRAPRHNNNPNRDFSPKPAAPASGE